MFSATLTSRQRVHRSVCRVFTPYIACQHSSPVFRAWLYLPPAHKLSGIRVVKCINPFVRSSSYFDWPTLKTSLDSANQSGIAITTPHSTIAVAGTNVNVLVHSMARFLASHMKAVVPVSELVFMVREALAGSKAHKKEGAPGGALPLRAGVATKHRVFFAEECEKLRALIVTIEFVSGGKSSMAHVDAMMLDVGEDFEEAPDSEYVLV